MSFWASGHYHTCLLSLSLENWARLGGVPWPACMKMVALRLGFLALALSLSFCHVWSMAMQKSSVEVHSFGHGNAAKLFTLRRGPMLVKITNWGAVITSLFVPDKHGKSGDVVLGFDSLTPYQNGTSPYFGAVVGRVANRIANASFSLNGVEYKLTPNEPPNTLHGGLVGYDKVLWKVKHVIDGESPSVCLTYHSYDGEEGFPGDLDVSVTYTLTGECELRTEMEAVPTQKATPVNLAHHSYWNLAGQGKGDVLKHKIRIWASHYTPVGKGLIPTGEIRSVDRTPFDLRANTVIGSRILQIPGGFDHNFALDKKGKGSLHRAARVEEPSSGRVMELLTTAPGLQFYTGNGLSGIRGKSGSIYEKHDGLCLESQGFPNAVNQPNFPSVIVSPGQVYRHTMVHKFHTK